MSTEFHFWLDAHLSDKIAKFIETRYAFPAQPIRKLGGATCTERSRGRGRGRPHNVNPNTLFPFCQ